MSGIGGVEFDGSIHTLDEKGVLHAVTAAGKDREVPAENVISIDFGSKAVAPETLLPREFIFSNGDRIRAQIAGAQDVPKDLARLDQALGKAQSVVIKSPYIGNVTARTEHLYAIVHHGRAEELNKKPGFVEREAGQTRRDWVWLANGDTQQGRIEGFLKNDHGKVDMFYASGVKRFRVDVYGVVAARFQQFLPPDKVIPPGLAAVLTLVDGSVVSGPVLGFSRASLKLRLIGGNEVEISKSEIQHMTFRNGRLVYLSPLTVRKVKDEEGEEIVLKDLTPVERLDLTPSAVKCVPYFSREFTPLKDRSYGGNEITLGSRAFLRGIGTHSYSELTYDLDGRFERFETVVGIDSEVGRRGNVLFRVVVDGKDRLEDCRMRGGDPAKPVRVSLGDAKELKLIVEYGGDFDIADHADWGGACVIRRGTDE